MQNVLQHILNYVIPGFVCLGLFLAIPAHAQNQDEDGFDAIGGPYEPDSATVLLFNFNEQLEGIAVNQVDSTEDGTIGGEPGTHQYVPAAALGLDHADFGSALLLDNSGPNNDAHITVPDTNAISMTEDWTMELWVYVNTFGETSDDWRHQPRLMFKPGDPFWFSNYYMTMWGGVRHFKMGYYDGNTHIELQSPDGLFRPRQWYHLAYIRDHSLGAIIGIIHEVNEEGEMEMFHFETLPYDKEDNHPPLVNNNPLHLGKIPADRHYLDGYLNEVRISNSVRNFRIPPAIASIDRLGRQSTAGEEDYEINSTIAALGDAEVEEAYINYRVNWGDWQQVPLDLVEGEQEFRGFIPNQDEQSIVHYYIEAHSTTGMSALSPAAAEAEENPEFYSFAVTDDESQLLGLTFETGEGVPEDTESGFLHTVNVFGEEPTYSDDAIVGDYSLHLNDETTYYTINSPALNTSEIQLEFWFKADSIPDHNTRLMGRRGDPSWTDLNYEVRFQDIDGVGGHLSAGSHLENQEGNIPMMTNELVLDDPIETDVWYHAIFRVSENVEADSSLATLQLRRADQVEDLDNPLDSPPNQHGAFLFFSDKVTVTPSGDFFLGRLFSGSQYFSGKVDGIRLYNYEKDPQEFDPEVVSVEKITGDIPETITLEANYPNPFNPSTNISYAIPNGQHVTVTVYDALGREVARLVDEYQSAGNYTVRFDAAGLSSGMYIYRLETSETRLTRQMMFIK